ncbi:hypothetical protein LOTGIDRAFT_231434 [Lottia gigantea]|uniref:Apple domain-containing protein n=1 Tax=Lottia gigantea TaxID=225164 RepID=V4AXR6_LOTGI|nr:hypothetical protein LOTGIDRAFT_231434 [Lottia gigantea]ESO98386.1 hypothetical protein LOTGIDRAFT_231434 [Lottia gigantea]
MNVTLILAFFVCQLVAIVSSNCAVSNGGCKMLCNTQPSGFTCSCFSGYILADNGFNCIDCKIRGRFINILSLNVVPNSNQASCQTECSNTLGCAVSALNQFDSCVLHSSPIIYVGFDKTEQECIDECSQMGNCLTLNHGTNGECLLFDVTYGAIPSISGWSVRSDGSYTIIEKGTCPSVL